MSDDFYIGWESRSAPRVARTTRAIIAGLFLAALLIAAGLAVAQRAIGNAVFEWGNLRQFHGVLKLQPYPHLLAPRPGRAGSLPNYSTYLLVAPFKFGLDRDKLAPLDGRNVTLAGTLIYRGNQAMIEAAPESIKASAPAESLPVEASLSLGRQTIAGEIVDSKCFYGVMNPGQLAPHRACAIRCISGGIPPVFVARQQDGSTAYLLLVSADGKPVNNQVLDKVAEPLEITGEVERQGEMLILRADPAAYRRVK